MKNKKSKAGVWMDHREAIVVVLTETGAIKMEFVALSALIRGL
jgi:hypothetical protein